VCPSLGRQSVERCDSDGGPLLDERLNSNVVDPLSELCVSLETLHSSSSVSDSGSPTYEDKTRDARWIPEGGKQSHTGTLAVAKERYRLVETSKDRTDPVHDTIDVCWFGVAFSVSGKVNG